MSTSYVPGTMIVYNVNPDKNFPGGKGKWERKKMSDPGRGKRMVQRPRDKRA